MSIEVSSDDEEQQEFYGVFQKVFEMRLLEFQIMQRNHLDVLFFPR